MERNTRNFVASSLVVAGLLALSQQREALAIGFGEAKAAAKSVLAAYFAGVAVGEAPVRQSDGSFDGQAVGSGDVESVTAGSDGISVASGGGPNPAVSTTAKLEAIADATMTDNLVLAANGTIPVTQTVSSLLDEAIGSTRGSILERGASGWAIITPGTSGLPFVSAGAGADPAYNGTLSGMGEIAQVGSVAATGAGTVVREGYKQRVYTYTGSAGGITTLVESQSGSIVTNTGTTASQPAYVTLPTLTATSQIGIFYTFVLDDTDGMRVIAGSSDTITISNVTCASSGFFYASTTGSTITLVAVSITQWIAIENSGLWIKDSQS